MTAATCLTCGAWGRVEAHHVAGRRNNPVVTVPVCLDCHRILTVWQRACGIDLDDGPGRSELDADRALLVGLTHLMELFVLRYPDLGALPAPLARLVGRAASHVLDVGQDPHRRRRWTPDPTTQRPQVTPARCEGEDQTGLLSQWAHLLASVGGLVGLDEATQGRFRQIGQHPDRFRAAFADTSGDPDRAEAVAGFAAQVERFRETTMLLTRAILAGPHARAALDVAAVQDVTTATLRIALATLPVTVPGLTQAGAPS